MREWRGPSWWIRKGQVMEFTVGATGGPSSSPSISESVSRRVSGVSRDVERFLITDTHDAVRKALELL